MGYILALCILSVIPDTIDTTSVGSNYICSPHKTTDTDQILKAERDILAFFGKTLIRLYQVVLSPHQGEVCNFTPSCSNYAYQSIEKYGLLGVIMAADRLERCHYFAWQYKDKYYKVKWVEKSGNKLYDSVDNKKF